MTTHPLFTILLAYLLLGTPVVAASSSENWVLNRFVDEMDDLEVINVISPFVNDKSNEVQSNIVIEFYCNHKELVGPYPIIHFSHLEIDGNRDDDEEREYFRIRFRKDKQKPITTQVYTDLDGRPIVFFQVNNESSFIEFLKNPGKELLMEVNFYGKGNLLWKFDLTGVPEKINNMASHCSNSIN